MTSIILAGGKSSRLGRNKALQTIGGKSLIQWVIDRVALLSNEVILVTGNGEAIPSSSSARIRITADIYPAKGPLAGIHSGLVAASTPRAMVVSCDTPFLNVRFLEYLIQIHTTCDIVVPRVRDKVEPLCAVYSRNCLAHIQKLLEQNELTIVKLFDLVKVRYVEEDEINRFDPEHFSFFNINNQDDLKRARRLAAQKGWPPAQN